MGQKQREQNAKMPKYKHDKIQKKKIQITKIPKCNKIQMEKIKIEQNAKVPKD